MLTRDEFNSRFDAAYSAQLYRRFCTDADHQSYLERYLNDTDLAAEAEDRYKSDRPFDESEPF